jgi:two-component sensor histidine kinase
VEHSVPLALIIVEMAMNAAKYAFPNKDQGTVSVTTEAGDGKLLVEVADDGVGADPDASPEGSGLGMKIVRALTAQLKADSGYVGTTEGTKFRIRMPIPS